MGDHLIKSVVRIQLSEDNIENDYENSDLFVSSNSWNQVELLEKTNRVLATLRLNSRDNDTVMSVPTVIQALELEDIYPIKISTADWIV